MVRKLTELELNVYTLSYIAEDHGHLVDVAIEAIVDVVNVLKYENPELALELSQVYAKEDFWERSKQWALANYLELQEEL